MKGGTFLSLFCRHLRRLMRLNNRIRGPAKIIEMGCGKNFRLSACDKGPLGGLMMLMIFVKSFPPITQDVWDLTIRRVDGNVDRL